MTTLVLECQSCGAVLRRLTDQEAQVVAAHRLVAYCRLCRRDAHIREKETA